MSKNAFATDRHSSGVLLAESENVTVFQCSCGSIHLQVGAVCLTMQPDELAEINDVVRQAIGRVGVPQTLATSLVN